AGAAADEEPVLVQAEVLLRHHADAERDQVEVQVLAQVFGVERADMAFKREVAVEPVAAGEDERRVVLAGRKTAIAEVDVAAAGFSADEAAAAVGGLGRGRKAGKRQGAGEDELLVHAR